PAAALGPGVGADIGASHSVQTDHGTLHADASSSPTAKLDGTHLDAKPATTATAALETEKANAQAQAGTDGAGHSVASLGADAPGHAAATGSLQTSTDVGADAPLKKGDEGSAPCGFWGWLTSRFHSLVGAVKSLGGHASGDANLGATGTTDVGNVGGKLGATADGALQGLKPSADGAANVAGNAVGSVHGVGGQVAGTLGGAIHH